MNGTVKIGLAGVEGGENVKVENVLLGEQSTRNVGWTLKKIMSASKVAWVAACLPHHRRLRILYARSYLDFAVRSLLLAKLRRMEDEKFARVGRIVDWVYRAYPRVHLIAPMKQ